MLEIMYSLLGAAVGGSVVFIWKNGQIKRVKVKLDGASSKKKAMQESINALLQAKNEADIRVKHAEDELIIQTGNLRAVEKRLQNIEYSKVQTEKQLQEIKLKLQSAEQKEIEYKNKIAKLEEAKQQATELIKKLQEDANNKIKAAEERARLAEEKNRDTEIRAGAVEPRFSSPIIKPVSQPISSKEEFVSESSTVKNVDAPQIVNVSPPAVSFNPNDIRAYILQESERIPFGEDMEDNKSALKKMMDVDKMIEYLQTSGHNKAEFFIQDINGFKKKLDSKFMKKAKNCEEDELSFELTKLFMGTLSENILTLTRSMYYSAEDDREFYQSFLSIFNEYLGRCGVYTKTVLPNRKCSDDDINNMKAQYKDVDDISMHGMIYKVEQLPYFMKYTDEYGDVNEYKCDGFMFVYRAKGQ